MNCTRMYYVLSVCVCKYQRVEQTFYNLFNKPLSLCCGTEHALPSLADLKAAWPAWPAWRRHGLPGRPESAMACLADLKAPWPAWPTWRQHGLPGRPEGVMACLAYLKVACLADLKAPWPAWPTWRRPGLTGRPKGALACLANLMRPSLPGRPEGDMACPQIKAHWAEDGPDCPIAWVQAGPGFVYTCSVLQQKINSLFR